MKKKSAGVEFLLDTAGGFGNKMTNVQAGDEFQYHTGYKRMIGYRMQGKCIEGQLRFVEKRTHTVEWQKVLRSKQEFLNLMARWARQSGLRTEVERMKKKGPWKSVLSCRFFKKEVGNGKRKER